jgi:hypothetical protein
VRRLLHTFMSRRCATVIVSMYKMSAGKGYEYLLRTAAVEDGNGELATALTTRYASEAGPSRATPVSRPGLDPA